MPNRSFPNAMSPAKVVGAWFDRPRGPALALLLGSVMVLGGCGDTPKPFQHDPGQGTTHLVRLSTANRVEIWIPRGTPEMQDQARLGAWAGEVERALKARDIPASVQLFPVNAASLDGPTGYALGGQVIDNNRDGVFIRWTLFTPEGTPLSERDIPILGDGHMDPAPLERLSLDIKLAVEKDMEQPLVTRMAAAAPAPLPPGLRAPTTPQEIQQSIPAMDTLPALSIGAVQGFGESRDSLLSGALQRQLKRAGVPLRPDALLNVVGEISQELLGDSIVLRIVWHVMDREGNEVGAIRQENPVPAEILEKQFPALAVAIAEGGVDGLVALLAQLPADAYRP